MKMAAKDVHSISNNNSNIKSTGVSFDSIWNIRAWQTKERVADVIAQKTGKVTDIERKTTYYRDYQNKPKLEAITK